MSKSMSKQFRAEVRKRAQRHPNFVYETPDPGGARCMYINPKNGAGSCIIGRAALAIGADRELLKMADVSDHGGAADYVLADLFHDKIDKTTRFWAAAVQHRQDHSGTWADSVASADKIYPEIAKEDGITV